MANLICKVNGSWGRRIDVYDNKCVITTDSTLGSQAQGNFRDGEKTIFYPDIVAVQYFPGPVGGYIQFEIPSMQMDKSTSNEASENTFTFRSNNENKQIAFALKEYIISRIEHYKFHTDERESRSALQALAVCLSDKNFELSAYAWNLLEEVKREGEAARLQAEQRKQAEQMQRAAKIKEELEENGLADGYLDFMAMARAANDVMEIQKIWTDAQIQGDLISEEIGNRITKAAKIARMYGSSAKAQEKLLDEIQSLIEGKA